MSLTLPPLVPDPSQSSDSATPRQDHHQQHTYQTAIQQFKQLVAKTMEWSKRKYNEQYERWVPWLEDWYLKLFTRDNKASYATKDHLAKTKVSGNEHVDALQDDAHAAAAAQIGQDGVARPVGDVVSKEALNRAERKGKDEHGDYVPSQVDVGGGGGVGAATGLDAAVADAAGVREDGGKDVGKGKAKGKGWFGGRK